MIIQIPQKPDTTNIEAKARLTPALADTLDGVIRHTVVEATSFLDANVRYSEWGYRYDNYALNRTVRESFDEIATGRHYRHHNATAMLRFDREMAAFLIERIEAYREVYSDTKRNTTRLLNVINEALAQAENQMVNEYKRRVEWLEWMASRTVTTTEYRIDYETRQSGFEITPVLISSEGNARYHIAKVYINILPVIDEDGNVKVQFSPSDSSWTTPNDPVYDSLGLAKVEAERMIRLAMMKRDADFAAEIASAQVVLRELQVA
jgi:hypothetical protein